VKANDRSATLESGKERYVTGTCVPALLWPLLAAPFIGSFLGVLICRLPAGQPVVFSRSACPSCGTRLTAVDLIPLASFAALRGRCRRCGQPIGWFHPLVEIAAAAVALWCVLADADPARVWIDCALGWTLLTLAWIDWASFLLPDVLTLPLLLAGLTVTFLRMPDALTDHCLAAALAYLLFQGVALGYRRLRGRDGLGGGDARLIAAAGAWCGLEALPFVILCSAVVGLLAAIAPAIIGRRVTLTTRLPFGPCIALAFWLAWLHGGLVDDLNQMLGGP
jgi:leader peptidase (prepilin peptidase)/N-methyltransferase